MNPTDQLAAEAADKLHGVRKRDNPATEALRQETIKIILAAIEKAYQAGIDHMAEWNKDNSPRAAHASKPVEVEVFGHKVKAKPAHASEHRFVPHGPDRKCRTCGKPAHASEQKWTPEYVASLVGETDCNGFNGAWAIADAHNATLAQSGINQFICVHHTDNERAQMIGSCPVCNRLSQSDDTKRLDWLLSSESKKHGIRIAFKRPDIDAAMSQTKEGK